MFVYMYAYVYVYICIYNATGLGWFLKLRYLDTRDFSSLELLQYSYQSSVNAIMFLLIYPLIGITTL